MIPFKAQPAMQSGIVSGGGKRIQSRGGALTLIRRKAYENRAHPEIMASLNNLSLAHGLLGKFPEALSLFKQSLAMHRVLYGTNATNLGAADILNNLGQVYLCLGNRTESIACYQRAFEVYMKQLGSEHPNTKRAKNILADFRERI